MPTLAARTVTIVIFELDVLGYYGAV